jgi:hypothetical protein
MRFVMVHGAFVGAWCWEPLVGPLEAAGHTVETLDLPGSGEDPCGESVRIPDGAFDIPRSYVLCRRDRAIPPALQRRLEQAGCTEVVELDTDHVPHLSATAELADVLDRLAVRMLPASPV